MGQSTQPGQAIAHDAAHTAANSVLMIRPNAFSRNEVTLPTNAFQSRTADGDADLTAARARREFDGCAAALERLGVDLQVFEGRTTSRLPDEIFPNNWISTHADGTVVLYPMMAWNRRPERRRDVLDRLQQRASGFRVERIVDLSDLEDSGSFLEGTGSLVFDHQNHLAYAALSPRTHKAALREFARRTGFGLIAFDTLDENEQAIYHTNVMLTLGERFALVCLDAVPGVTHRFRLLSRLERSGREIIELDLSQLREFCGNVIQLRAGSERFVVMSARARAAFDEAQLEALGRHGRLVTVDIPTIERSGGGSIRCMLAELFLPRKPNSR